MVKNKFAKKVSAALLAVTVAISAVAPGVYASETVPEDASEASTVYVEAEVAPVEEPEETEAPSGENENDTVQDDGAQEEAEPEIKDEKPESEEQEQGEQENSEKKESESGETAENPENEKEEASGENQPSENPEQAVKPEEGKEEKEIKKSRVEFRFDDGAGTVKVIISSDEGASKENPSVTLTKEEGKDAEADYRSDSVKALAADNGSVKDNTVSLDLEEGTKVTVFAEAAEGFTASEYSIKEDGDKDVLSFNAEEKEFRHEFSVGEKPILFEAKTVKDEVKEEAKEKEVQFGLKLDSAGGNVTVDVKDKEGKVTSYSAIMGEDGKVTVNGEGKDEYALFIEAEEEATVTVTAVADEYSSISAFIVTTPDGKKDAADTKGIIEKIAGFFTKENKVSKTFEITKGLTTTEVSFSGMPEFDATAKAGTLTLKIHADKGVLPEGTVVEARELTKKETDAYRKKAEEMTDAAMVAAVDITFKDKDGKEIQPNGMVDVEFEGITKANNVDEDKTISVCHVVDEKTAEVEKIDSEFDGNKVSISNDEFSPYMLLAASGEPNWTSGGQGTWVDLKGKANITLSTSESDGAHYYNLDKRDFGEGHSATYTIFMDGNRLATSVCINPHFGADVASNPDHIWEYTTPMLVKALYYGAYGPGRSVVQSIADDYGYGDDIGAQDLITHYAASKIYEELGWSKSGNVFSGTTPLLRNMVNDFGRAIESRSVPSNYHAFVMAYNNSGVQDFAFAAPPVVRKGKIKLHKVSSNPSITNGNSNYSYSGAVYWVYTSEATAKARGNSGWVGASSTMTTGANGSSNTVELDEGTYYVIEGKAPNGYIRSDIVYTVRIPADSTVDIEVKDPPQTNTIKVVKSSSRTDMTDGNPCYSLAGAKFEIYNASGTKVDTLVTDASGKTPASKELPLGNYTVKEVEAPVGYKLNTTAVPVNASTYSATPYTATIEDTPAGDPITIMVDKHNANENTLDPADISPLSGAVFKVTFYKELLEKDDFNADGTAKTATVDRTWYITTKKVGDIYGAGLETTYLDPSRTSSEFYMFGNTVGLPLGTFTITEEQAPAAYESNGAFGTDGFLIGQIKWNEEKQKAVASIIQGKYVVEYNAGTDVETITASVSDKPVKPDVKTTVKDNASGTHMVYASEPVEVTMTDTITYSGLYPGKKYTANLKVVDRAAAAALGDLSDKEMFEQAEALIDADGNPVIGTAEFTASASGAGTADVVYTFKVDPSYMNRTYVALEKLVPETGTPLFHADINDVPQTFKTPEIGTTASEAVFDENGILTFTDTIEFKKLEANEEYKAVGTVIDKETKEPLLVDGKAVTAEKTFSPEGEVDEDGFISGTVDVEFKFDGRGLEGKAFVIFEEVYVKGELIASHKDLEDEKQFVELPTPEGKTKAIDKQTGTNLAADNEDDTVTISDDFTFKGLIPGTKYGMYPRVMHKEDEKEIESSIVSFTSRKIDENGEPVDEAVCKFVTADGEETDSATDGMFYFIPNSTDGIITIEFEFNKAELKGSDVVVFENVKRDETDIIVHEDINDEDQTVHIPEGGTEARDQLTDDQTSKAEGTRIIVDYLKYSNLLPGETYSVTGTVMLLPYTPFVDEEGNVVEAVEDAEEETSVEAVPLEGAQMVDKDGNPIDAHTFTPDEKDGVEELYFSIDASQLAGRTIVLFETVKYNDVDVIVHADINDEPQKVFFPDGGTKATDARTQTHTSFASEEAVINDEVEFHNLIVGKEYAVSGVLYDKATKQPLLVNGEPVVSEPKTFVPSESDGSVTVVFKFDSSALQGHILVAFEKVTVNGVEVFTHEEIDDEAQTIYIPKIGTTATDKADGDHTLATSGNVVVEDNVSYTNLNTELEYKVEAVLVEKSSGRKVGVNGKIVTNTVNFVPKTADGNITVPLSFNVTNLKSGEYVVFEKVYEINPETGKENLVGSHEDLKDSAQTVRVPNRPGRRVQTGDFPVVPVATGAAIILVIVSVVVVMRKKKG